MAAAITDWDDAYANGAHVSGAEKYPQQWSALAAAYRQDMKTLDHAKLDIAYGLQPRERYDIFEPTCEPNGIVIFVHGGYWMKLDNSYWSHLAAGAVNSGHSFVIPSYTLCPDCSIEDITAQIAELVMTVARRNTLPIRLVGHSAGGQLVARMLCEDVRLEKEIRQRIVNVVSISGVHDLRPLLRTTMNITLGLTRSSAARESPALCTPVSGTLHTNWVGELERPEFIRQSRLLANIWYGLGADTSVHIETGRHHFDIIDDLRNPASALVATLLRD